MKKFLWVFGALLALGVLSVALNSVRWDYLGSASVAVIDRWTGERYSRDFSTGEWEEPRPGMLRSTATYVFGGAGVAAMVALLVLAVTKKKDG